MKGSVAHGGRAAVAAAMLCLVLFACKREPDHAAVADNEIVILYQTIEMSMRERDYSTVRESIESIYKAGVYPRLSPAMRYQVDKADGFSAFWLHLGDQSHDAFVRMTKSPLADNEAWVWRLESAKLANDFRDAFTAFRVLRKRKPDFPMSMNDFTIHVLEQGFGTLPTAEAQLAFEQQLEDSRWEPTSALFSRSVIWWHYALNLYGIDDRRRGDAVAKRIDDPGVVIAMRADRRFDTLVEANPAQFDVRKETEALIGATRSLIARDPADLGARWSLAVRQLNAGHAREALQTVEDAATAAIQMTDVDKANHPFHAQEYDQLLTMKAHILFDLGRTGEALGVASSVGAACHCGVGSDMALLTADLLVRLDRGRDALSRLKPITNDKLTFEAQAMAAQLRTCAAVQASDRTALNDNLDFLRHHPNYSPYYLVQALLCADDMDGAAQAVIAGLHDVRSRGLYLQMLQVYLPPDKPTPFERKQRTRWDRLRERGDIVAAVAPIGRIARYDVRFQPLY